MDEQLKQIGERLRGLREVLDIPVSEMAETIGKVRKDRVWRDGHHHFKPDEDSQEVWHINGGTHLC